MDAQDLENSTPYKLGQMDTRLHTLEKDVADIKADVKTLVAALNQQKGSKGTIAAWGTGGVGAGGLIVAALQFWLGGDRPAVAAPTQPPVITQPTPSQQWAPGQQYQQPQADQRVNPTAQF